MALKNPVCVCVCVCMRERGGDGGVGRGGKGGGGGGEREKKIKREIHMSLLRAGPLRAETRRWETCRSPPLTWVGACPE